MNLHLILELQKTSFFRDLSQEEIKALFKDSKYRDVPNHKALFSQGQEAQSFGVVLFGGFKIVKEGKNKTKSILHFGVPGDLLGAMFMTQPCANYSVSVIAMGPSAALEISKEIYLENWEGNVKIREKLKKHFFLRMQDLQSQHIQTKQPLKIKIASLFLQLLAKEKSTIAVPIPITRQEIADFTGASVEAVIRNLSSMSDLISTKEKSITILNLSALKALASKGEY